MLRIHFTREDLAKTRVATTWGPLGETFFSLMTLQRHNPPPAFAGWHRRTHGIPAARHPAAALFRDEVLDLFTLTGRAASLEEGMEALRAAHPRHMEAEIVGAGESHARYFPHAPAWSGADWGDPAHDRADRQSLLDFIDAYHRAAVLPHWPRVLARLQAEQTSYARILAEHGVEAMLSALPPGFRWRPPVLEVGRGKSVGESRPAGRGLTLVPSVFCQTRLASNFVSAVDPQAPVLLFFPVVRTIADAAAVLTPRGTAELRALESLLGRTRARALDAIGQGPCTTGRLAQRLSVSPASASEHATVLRKAGLITTTRHGSAVLHSLTPLGTTLLNGTPSSAGSA